MWRCSSLERWVVGGLCGVEALRSSKNNVENLAGRHPYLVTSWGQLWRADCHLQTTDRRATNSAKVGDSAKGKEAERDDDAMDNMCCHEVDVCDIAGA